VHPFDDPRVIAGQGTIGLEILEDCEPDCVIVPIGGGGLISGIATAVKVACGRRPRSSACRPQTLRRCIKAAGSAN
jgi:threonine dehydratase